MWETLIGPWVRLGEEAVWRRGPWALGALCLSHSRTCRLPRGGALRALPLCVWAGRIAASSWCATRAPGILGGRPVLTSPVLGQELFFRRVFVKMAEFSFNILRARVRFQGLARGSKQHLPLTFQAHSAQGRAACTATGTFGRAFCSRLQSKLAAFQVMQ